MTIANEQAAARTGDPGLQLKNGRRRIARSRGALSGLLLIVLGAWAAIVPFIGPYLGFGILPSPDEAWNWTSGRGLYELLPGAVTLLAGIVLLISASRTLTVTMAWLAALSGAWLVVGPTLDAELDVGVGTFPIDSGTGKLVALALFYYYAIGVAIAIIAGTALGRLSVHSVRDVRAAGRRDERGARAERDARADRNTRADQGTRTDRDVRDVTTGTDRPVAARPAATRPVAPQDGRSAETPAGPVAGRVDGDDQAGRHERPAPQ